MFRDIKEISKKYELINKRKNRVSYDRNLKKVNDISFNNDSIKRNKYKYKIWKINIIIRLTCQVKNQFLNKI